MQKRRLRFRDFRHILNRQEVIKPESKPRVVWLRLMVVQRYPLYKSTINHSHCHLQNCGNLLGAEGREWDQDTEYIAHDALFH